MGLFSPRVSTKSMVQLCRTMATSYGGGLPILRTLELTRSNSRDSRTRTLVGQMADEIRKGATLGEAARHQSKYLPPIFIELLSSGEVGGNLDVILLDLANYYEDRQKMRRMIMGKSAYPILQLVAAWFLGSFALMLIRNLHFTGTPFNLNAHFQRYFQFQMVAMTVFAGVFAGCVVLARLGIFKWISGWISTHLWPLAPVTRRFAHARFFKSLALLIGSGVPIVRAIERSAAASANPYIERDLLKAVPMVMNGGTLVAAFGQSRLLPPVAREMLMVGEQSGKIEAALQKVAQYQVEEATHAVNIATRVAEVLIILLVGAVVGYIVISFYSTYLGRLGEI